MEARQLLPNKKTAVTVGSADSVRQAAHKMGAYKIGAVLVLDSNEKLSGIISERDIARGLDEFGSDLPDKRVDDLATKPIVACAPGDDVFELIWLMDTNRIRHLPVVDGDDLLGMISLRDVMRTLLKGADDESRQLRQLVLAERPPEPVHQATH